MSVNLGDLPALTVGTVALVGAATVAVFEYRRYRHDPSRRPPLTPDEAATDRFHNSVAVLIGLVSVCGALLAWRISTISSSAGGRGQAASQALVRNNEVSSVVESDIAFGGLQALQWQTHLVAAQKLRGDADAAWMAASDTQNANASENRVRALLLEAQAREEEAAQRLTISSFYGFSFPHRNPDGTVAYDANQGREVARAINQDYRTLGAVEEQASRDEGRLDRRARYLVVTGIIFAFALLLLTIANLGPPHRRLYAVVPGVLTIATAMVIFTSVEQVLWV